MVRFAKMEAVHYIPRLQTLVIAVASMDTLEQIVKLLRLVLLAPMVNYAKMAEHRNIQQRQTLVIVVALTDTQE